MGADGGPVSAGAGSSQPVRPRTYRAVAGLRGQESGRLVHGGVQARHGRRPVRLGNPAGAGAGRMAGGGRRAAGPYWHSRRRAIPWLRSGGARGLLRTHG